MKKKLVLSVLAGLLAAVAFHLLRGYPPKLSSLFGAAIGALVFAALRTVDELRRTLGR
jgi:hypothetical protein